MKLEKTASIGSKITPINDFLSFFYSCERRRNCCWRPTCLCKFWHFVQCSKIWGEKSLIWENCYLSTWKKSRIFSKFSQTGYFSSSFFRALWYLVFFSNANSISFFFSFFQSIKKSFDGILNFFAAYYVAHLHLKKLC